MYPIPIREEDRPQSIQMSHLDWKDGIILPVIFSLSLPAFSCLEVRVKTYPATHSFSLWIGSEWVEWMTSSYLPRGLKEESPASFLIWDTVMWFFWNAYKKLLLQNSLLPPSPCLHPVTDPSFSSFFLFPQYSFSSMVLFLKTFEVAVLVDF